MEGSYARDTVYNEGTNVTIFTHGGNDFIDNKNSNVTIEGGDDNDTITNSAQSRYSYISGGKGADSIVNTGSDVLFNYVAGDGDDIIHGFNSTSTLSITGGVYATTVKRDNDVIVSVGNDRMILIGAASLSAVNIVEKPVNINNNNTTDVIFTTNADDTITNSVATVVINALRGNDSINNNALRVSIDSGAGNDKVINIGSNVTINAKSGDDSIKNTGSNVTINGNSGKDTITNSGATVSISGGNDNDFIDNTGSKVTITGGKGDDTIKLNPNATDALIIYNRDDGNDVIEGFNATSVLQIGNGSDVYTKSISGDDVIVKVNDDKITLKGAASLANVNIVGTTKLVVNNTVNGAFLVGSRLKDSVVNSGLQVTINTYDGKDTIQNYSRQVIIDSGNGNDFIENKNSNSVTIEGGLGDDVIISQRGFANKIIGGRGNDSIDILTTFFFFDKIFHEMKGGERDGLFNRFVK